ncbi:MAG: hypothetical protein HQM08_21955 [Candidatus Riflebacteria bacterium]|nr:hypothetical protein [Candidatus Riflebacteria bacterium]
MRYKFFVFATILFFVGNSGNIFAFPAPPPWLSPSGVYSSEMPPSPQGFCNVPGRYDRNNDGKVDLIVLDRNGDGKPDYWATDRDFDGYFDDYQYDRNFDGKIDQWEYDTNHDGIPEKIFIDVDGDGRAELVADLNPYTKTYTWRGDLKEINASTGTLGATPKKVSEKGTSRPSKSKSKKKLAKGKAAFSE